MDKERLIRNARRILEAGMASAKTDEGRNRIEEMQLHVDGYAAGEGDAEVIVTGNWNACDRYDADTRTRVVTDDIPKRMCKAFEAAGIEIEWSDEWTTCDDCQKLLRTSPDSYSWTPSYVDDHEGNTLCECCVNPAEYLESIEGDHNRANTIDSINPTEHGYVRLEGDFEAGLHPGQDASPALIATALEAQGVKRFLFQIDDVGQFDSRFSVYVHEDEEVDMSAFKAAPKDGPSRAAAMERGLQAAAQKMGELQGEGIKYAKIGPDGEAEVRLVSQEEFIRGIK